MLLRILLLALAVWLIFILLRQYRRSVDAPATSEQAASQDMVRCALCGVHLPKNEGVERDGDYFCCEEHSRRAQ